MVAHQIAKNEFSRVIDRDRLASAPLALELRAEPHELGALARRFGFLEIKRLSARIHIKPSAATSLIVVNGTLEAEVTQACIVTLQPVDCGIQEAIEASFTLTAQDGREQDLEIDPLADDPPEEVGLEGLDLGEWLAQQLMVAVDPYPRSAEVEAEDAAVDGVGVEGGGGKGRDWRDPDDSSPFAVLKSLKGAS